MHSPRFHSAWITSGSIWITWVPYACPLHSVRSLAYSIILRLPPCSVQRERKPVDNSRKQGNPEPQKVAAVTWIVAAPLRHPAAPPRTAAPTAAAAGAVLRTNRIGLRYISVFSKPIAAPPGGFRVVSGGLLRVCRVGTLLHTCIYPTSSLFASRDDIGSVQGTYRVPTQKTPGKPLEKA